MILAFQPLDHAVSIIQTKLQDINKIHFTKLLVFHNLDQGQTQNFLFDWIDLLVYSMSFQSPHFLSSLFLILNMSVDKM